ncbi:MAG: hypothetical protein KGZ90_15190 [Algoriphagus sp.]|nr:hypothetical protein [Algoriphagus sp.]
MTRIVLLFVLLFASGITLAQTEAPKKAVPSQVQAGEASKKVGISSAARRSSLPGTINPTGKPNADTDGPKADGPNKHVPNGGGPANRPEVRVPKNRPGGPITRPTGTPGTRPNVPPGTRPTVPRQRPPGG